MTTRRVRSAEFGGYDKALEKRKEIERKLSEAGWRSTGDLPYFFGHSLGLQKKTVHITSQIKGFLGEVMEGRDDEYRNNHVKKLGLKTYVSPEVIQGLEMKVRERFLTSE
ncbi:hypothetical protein HY969_03025 [Candidatus Kaiserbacteria bacterium]|nr:hypothetical protein [Candidatus Kaiserbacteria bacterium]